MPRLHIEYIVPTAADTIPLLAYSKPITLDNLMTPSDLTDFPVLIDIIDTDLKTDVQSDGDDIAFSMNGIALSHEIELFDQSYSPSQAHLVAWVKVPTLSSSSDTTITMHYGNPAVSSLENPFGVWNNYEAVYHMNSSPTSGPVDDSTSKGHDADALNMESGDVASQKIGNGYDFDGADERLQIGPVDTDSWGQITLSAWVNVDILDDYRVITKEAGNGDTHTTDAIFTLGVTPTGAIRARLRTDSTYTSQAAGTISAGSWSYITITWDQSLASGEFKIYLNGAVQGSYSLAGTSISDSGLDLFIGDTSVDSRSYDGKMDEARIANVARSADWLLAEYRNQNSPSTYITVGSEAGSPTWIDENTVRVELTTTSINPVTTDIAFTLDIAGSGQTLDENLNDGTTFDVANNSVVTWTANVLVNPPADTINVNVEIEYPFTEWNPISVKNPLGLPMTYGSDWNFQGGILTIYATSIDYWGLYTVTFESFNFIENVQLGIDGQSLGDTAVFNVNDVAAFRATTPWITNSRVGFFLTNPDGEIFETDFDTIGIPGTTWDIPSFKYRMQLTVPSSEVTAALTNYPLFVSFTDTDFTTKVQADGDDFVFVQNGIVLAHEIERFEQGTGRLVAWVRANLSSVSNTNIWLYYGNPVIGSTESPGILWSNGYEAVWHLGETVTNEGSGEPHYDSTFGNHTATHNGNQVTAGIANSFGQAFDGNDWIVVDSSKGLNPSGDVTISGWFYLNAAWSSASTPSMIIVEKYLDADNNFHIALAGADYSESGVPLGTLVFGFEYANSEFVKWTQRTFWSASTWYHFSCYMDADTPSNSKIYINGLDNTAAGSVGGASVISVAMSANWGIGGRYGETSEFPTGQAFLTGRLDEVRIASAQRASGWLRAEYNNTM
ncbi:MAG: DUF2341 domain-containing protein, partial [Candidatus Thorarchaeota archaeon]